MKLWTWKKEGYICKHCGQFNDSYECYSCDYKPSSKQFDWIRDRRTIKKTLHIRSSGFNINPFYIKTFVGLPQTEPWYCYSYLCEDFRCYRKMSKSSRDCDMMMIDHYRNICRVILSQLRAMSANTEDDYVEMIKKQSKRDRKIKRDRLEQDKKS